MQHTLCIKSLVIFLYFQITVSFDETTTIEDVDRLLKVFNRGKPVSIYGEKTSSDVSFIFCTNDAPNFG